MIALLSVDSTFLSVDSTLHFFWYLVALFFSLHWIQVMAQNVSVVQPKFVDANLPEAVNLL